MGRIQNTGMGGGEVTDTWKEFPKGSLVTWVES